MVFLNNPGDSSEEEGLENQDELIVAETSTFPKTNQRRKPRRN
jgi:hypothetical protein